MCDTALSLPLCDSESSSSPPPTPKTLVTGEKDVCQPGVQALECSLGLPA